MFCFSCSSGIDPDLYIDKKPELILEDYFNGNIDVWGTVEDRSGNLIKSFKAIIKASWDDNVGVLDEDFIFSDGKKQKKIWKIKKLPDGTYEGEAGDIVGKAIGNSYGNALRWNYIMDLEVDGSNYNIEFDDWMWLLDKKTLVNRSYMKKFGIRVGEISIFMRKE